MLPHTPIMRLAHPDSTFLYISVYLRPALQEVDSRVSKSVGMGAGCAVVAEGEREAVGHAARMKGDPLESVPRAGRDGADERPAQVAVELFLLGDCAVVGRAPDLVLGSGVVTCLDGRDSDMSLDGEPGGRARRRRASRSTVWACHCTRHPPGWRQQTGQTLLPRSISEP